MILLVGSLLVGSLLLGSLLLGIPQLVESLSRIPPVAERWGTFTAPLDLPAWSTIGFAIIAANVSTERALRLRYNAWLDTVGRPRARRPPASVSRPVRAPASWSVRALASSPGAQMFLGAEGLTALPLEILPQG
ncbi:hypothetical protein [Actinoplanes sp. NBRC 103695]|uniref:hypothetical protein n=1 Tax=Actinoplanes sp. NBRC 103695 TaxID=3032202 RepID=UPI00249FCC7C|nr:hypothetical protein [Actinoplanes sp. NBRC 103695]GLZ00469.1 hypothetical protein Acsp02_77210 [Actinoplanes sp. NBRC 103695]